MKNYAALALMLGLTAPASAATFKLECLDAYDGTTRLAVLEVNVEAETVRVYSESQHDWKYALNVSIADATISYVERADSGANSTATSVTVDRVTGKYVAYAAHFPRKDGRCKKVP